MSMLRIETTPGAVTCMPSASVSTRHDCGLTSFPTAAGQGGRGSAIVTRGYPHPYRYCKTIDDCTGNTPPNAPPGPPGADGSYFRVTRPDSLLRNYGGTLELTPYLSNEQLTMVRRLYWRIITYTL